MTRLYRPHIPVEVKCRVALRQLGEMWPDKVINANRATRKKEPNAFEAMVPHRRNLGSLLDTLLRRLASLLDCDPGELRLDHDPPLAARQYFKNGRGEIIRFVPDANDPDHLFYRPHGPQHAGSHLIKTNVRGDHGQHPDRVLIKKARRLEKTRAASSEPSRSPSRVKYSTPFPVRKTKWAARPFPKKRKVP